MSPTPGARVQARNAFGDLILMVAVTGPEAGLDFPVVWLCSPEEYDRATAAGDEPAAIAWPLDAVTTLEPA